MGRIRKLCMIKLALTEIYNYKLFVMQHFLTNTFKLAPTQDDDNFVKSI